MEIMQKETKKRKSHIFLFILLLIMVIGLGAYSYLNSMDGKIDLKSLNLYELFENILNDREAKIQKEPVRYINSSSSEHSKFIVYNNSIIECTEDKLVCYNRKGELLWNKSMDISNPYLKTVSDRLLVADIGGTKFYILNGDNIVLDKKLDNRILNADINNIGYISIIQEIDKKGYKGRVSVFDNEGLEVFSRNISEYFAYIANVVSVNNENYLINNGIDVSGVSANTILEYFNLKNPEEPFGSKIIENDILPVMDFFKNGHFVTVSDKEIIYFDSNRDEKWKKEFEINSIIASKLSENNITVVAKKKATGSGTVDNRKTEILAFDSKGENILSYDVDDKVINIETFEDIISINTGREVFFINLKGDLTGKYSSKSDVTNVQFLDKTKVAVISKENVAVTDAGF